MQLHYQTGLIGRSQAQQQHTHVDSQGSWNSKRVRFWLVNSSSADRSRCKVISIPFSKLMRRMHPMKPRLPTKLLTSLSTEERYMAERYTERKTLDVSIQLRSQDVVFILLHLHELGTTRNLVWSNLYLFSMHISLLQQVNRSAQNWSVRGLPGAIPTQLQAWMVHNRAKRDVVCVCLFWYQHKLMLL